MVELSEEEKKVFVERVKRLRSLMNDPSRSMNKIPFSLLMVALYSK